MKIRHANFDFRILLHCVLEIVECVSNPCQNGAHCVDSLDSYRCVCVAGYKGSQCETGTGTGCVIVNCDVSNNKVV